MLFSLTAAALRFRTISASNAPLFPRADNSTGVTNSTRASGSSNGPAAGNSSCPDSHVFGARETTAPPRFGTSSVIVNVVLGAFPGSTSEAIVYPTCGGQNTCGSISYALSATQGVAAVAKAVNAFNTQCPSTQLVMVGYSQGKLGATTNKALNGGANGTTRGNGTNEPVGFKGAATKLGSWQALGSAGLAVGFAVLLL